MVSLRKLDLLVRGGKVLCSTQLCYMAGLKATTNYQSDPKRFFPPFRSQLAFWACICSDSETSNIFFIWALLKAVLKSLLCWICIPCSWLNPLQTLGSGEKTPFLLPCPPWLHTGHRLIFFLNYIFFNLCYRTLIPLIFSVLILWYIAVMTFAYFLPSFVFFMFLKSVFWPGLVESNEEMMFWDFHRPAIFCLHLDQQLQVLLVFYSPVLLTIKQFQKLSCHILQASTTKWLWCANYHNLTSL